MFRANRSIATQIDGVAGGRGAGLFLDLGGNVIDCSFQANVVQTPDDPEDPNDGIIAGRGAGIYVRKFLNTCVNNEFYGNQANRGGGLFAENSQEGAFPARFNAYNCSFTANTAESLGGGADALGIEGEPGSQAFTNCIFWHNRGGSTDPVVNNLNAAADLDPADHCCIEDDAVGGTIPYNGAGNVNVNGNIDADPLFAEEITPPLDLALRSNSPCIDAGTTPPVPSDAFDVNAPDGNTAEKTPDLLIRMRVVDNAYIPDTGIATDESNNCGVVDIGAFEDQRLCGSGILGDMDGNGTVDGRDIQLFVYCHVNGGGATTPFCTCADLNRDYVLTFADVICFVKALLGVPTCEGLAPCARPVGLPGGSAQGQTTPGGGQGGNDAPSNGSNQDSNGNQSAGDGETNGSNGNGEAGGGDGAGSSDAADVWDPMNDPEDPGFPQRYAAYHAWLSEHPRGNYPSLSDDDYDLWTGTVALDMMYTLPTP